MLYHIRRVWMGSCCSRDIIDGCLIDVIAEHTSAINCMAVDDDDTVLVTGSDDATARVWILNEDDGHCQCIGTLIGHQNYVTCLTIYSTFVITGSADKTIRVWDIGDNTCTYVLSGHRARINRLICVNDYIYSTSYDHTVRCWSLDTGQCVGVFAGHTLGVYPITYIRYNNNDDNDDDDDDDDNTSLQEDIIITGSTDSTARSWSVVSGQCRRVFKGHTGPVMCLTSDPEGIQLFTGSIDNSIRSWDIVKGELLKVFTGHKAAVICLAYSKRTLFSASSDHTIRSWLPQFGECLRTYKAHYHTVTCLRTLQDKVFSGSGDGTVACFHSRSGFLQHKFTTSDASINSIEITKGKLITANVRGELCVWDVTSHLTSPADEHDVTATVC